ncbi:MAG: restriction endonuclease subunit S [Planctomycetes bacterium]|nr:restriction endonuclease subunit S [Planctomycetota bacterium]
MTKPWPKMKLGDVVTHRKEFITIDDLATYKRCRVQLHAKGIVLRDVVSGAEIKTKKQQVCRAGELLVAEIDAKHGGYGMVPDDLQDSVVSSHYFLFTVKDGIADRGFLGYCLRTPAFRTQVEAQGSTNYAAIRPGHVLEYEIPLPPLEEQRRIVNYLDTLSTKITQARTLRHRSTQEAAVFYAQARDRMFSELRADRKPVGDVFDLVNGRAFKPVEWQDVGRKIIRIQNLKYATVPYNRYAGRVDDKHLVRFGDVLFAWSGQVVSLGAHIWRDDEAILNQHIFNVRARTPMLPGFVREGFNALVDEMKTQVRGLEMFHIRKQELVRLKFPVPPLDEQRRIVAELDALQAKVDALKQLQADTEAELTALQSAALDRAFKGEL